MTYRGLSAHASCLDSSGLRVTIDTLKINRIFQRHTLKQKRLSLNLQKTIATLQKLAAADDNIEVVWLYGSQVKGNATVNSDYDLAIACDQEVIAQHAFYCDELSYQWSKATLEKISIIDINKVPIPLAYSAINDGKVIYCRYPLRLHSEQQRIWSLWEAFRNEHERNRA